MNVVDRMYVKVRERKRKVRESEGKGRKRNEIIVFRNECCKQNLCESERERGLISHTVWRLICTRQTSIFY